MRWFNLNTGIIILVIIIILVAIGAGIVGYSLWNVTKAKELFPFLEISEVFPTKAIALFTGLATFGTLLLALAMIVTIKNNNEREAIRRKDELSKESRHRKERLLNEIIGWAEYISSASVTPDISARTKTREINVLMRYGTSLTRSISIETIIGESFKEELLEDFINVINYLFKLMCTKQYMTFHTFPTEQGFPRDVLDEIKNEINNKKPIEDLFNEYATGLTRSVNELLRKANKIKTKDIDQC